MEAQLAIQIAQGVHLDFVVAANIHSAEERNIHVHRLFLEKRKGADIATPFNRAKAPTFFKGIDAGLKASSTRYTLTGCFTGTGVNQPWRSSILPFTML